MDRNESTLTLGVFFLERTTVVGEKYSGGGDFYDEGG